MLRAILRIAVPLTILVSYGMGLFGILVLTCCYTFPTRGFPTLGDPLLGLVTVPLAIFIDSLLLGLFIVMSKRYSHLWPKWVRDFFKDLI